MDDGRGVDRVFFAVEPFANTLLKWGFDPEAFLPVPSLAQELSSRGVVTVSVTHKSIATTPLSRMHFRGAKETRGYSYASDFWVSLRQVLSDYRRRRLFVSGYWSAVDTLAHKYGPGHITEEAEIRSISLLDEGHFTESPHCRGSQGDPAVDDADHGQIRTPAAETVVLTDHPDLRDLLWLPPSVKGGPLFSMVREGAYERALPI